MFDRCYCRDRDSTGVAALLFAMVCFATMTVAAYCDYRVAVVRAPMVPSHGMDMHSGRVDLHRCPGACTAINRRSSSGVRWRCRAASAATRPNKSEQSSAFLRCSPIKSSAEWLQSGSQRPNLLAAQSFDACRTTPADTASTMSSACASLAATTAAIGSPTKRNQAANDRIYWQRNRLTPAEPLQHHAHTLTCRHAGEFHLSH